MFFLSLKNWKFVIDWEFLFGNIPWGIIRNSKPTSIHPLNPIDDVYFYLRVTDLMMSLLLFVLVFVFYWSLFYLFFPPVWFVLRCFLCVCSKTLSIKFCVNPFFQASPSQENKEFPSNWIKSQSFYYAFLVYNSVQKYTEKI